MFAAADNKPDTSRRKSFGADSPEVVTTGVLNVLPFPGIMFTQFQTKSVQTGPSSFSKFAPPLPRRANRRIIMRQVGDRLIPVGVTSGRLVVGQDLLSSNSSSGAEGEK